LLLHSNNSCTNALQFFDMSVCLSCSFHLATLVTLYPSIVFLFCRFYSLPCYLSTSTLNVHISVPYHRCLQTCVIHVFFFLPEYQSLNIFSVISDSSPISLISIDLEFDPSVSFSLHSISSFFLLQKLQLSKNVTLWCRTDESVARVS
jgi:hypothetical protein